MYRKLNSIHLAQFGGQFFSLCLFQLGDASHRLRPQDVASPSVLCQAAAYLIVSVIVIGPDGFHQLCQSALVFPKKAGRVFDLCEGDSGAGLPVDQTPQPGLPLDNAVGNPHLTTQGRQENHQLEDNISSRVHFDQKQECKS
uniref:Uncharacterized protein n=1 Tax=Ailuropoda melanoleuca TaxID=9646 RepID=A0A7N5K0N4_AILME